MTSPDLSDRDVLELLDRNHKPEETAVTRQLDLLNSVTETEVRCKQCRQPYPCPTRQAITEYRKEELKRMWLTYPNRLCGRKGPHPEHSYTGFATSYYCPGVVPPKKCIQDEPHGPHTWIQAVGEEHRCPGTSYELMDCDDATHDVSHDAHSWDYRGARFWCHGG